MPFKRTRKSAKSSTRVVKRKTFVPRNVFGLRQERLSKDGTTWALEMATPASQMAPEAGIFKVTQSFSFQNFFSTSITVATFASISNSLSQVDNANSYAALFDVYRIDSVEIWLTPQTSASVSSRNGDLFTVIDLDDSTALTTLGQAEDYATCVTSPQSAGHYRHYIPHMAVAASGGGVFTSYANAKPMWCDTASPTISHYGVKIAASVSNGGSVQIYDLFCKLHLSFRNVR